MSQREATRAQTLAPPKGSPEQTAGTQGSSLADQASDSPTRQTDEEGAQIRAGPLRHSVLRALGPVCPQPSLRTLADLTTL